MATEGRLALFKGLCRGLVLSGVAEALKAALDEKLLGSQGWSSQALLLLPTSVSAPPSITMSHSFFCLFVD